MKGKRFVLAAAAAFVVIFALDYAAHGILLKGLYEQTASVWRPKPDGCRLMALMPLAQALFAAAMAWVYTVGYEKGKDGLGQGIRFGLYIAAILAPAQALLWYIVLPVPAELAFGWFASWVVDSLAAGITIGLVYRP